MGFTIVAPEERDQTGESDSSFQFDVHAPAGINNGDFSQLESRLSHGLTPSILVSGGVLSEEDRKTLEEKYLKTDLVKEVSFDMNIVSAAPVTKGWEFYYSVLKFVHEIHRKFPDKVSKRVGIKFGQADPKSTGSFLGSRISLDEYKHRYSANVDLVERLVSSSFHDLDGITFGIENSPVPNFAVTPTGVVDPHTRWNNAEGSKWGPGPRNTASLFAHPREIMHILNRSGLKDQNVTLDLDLEHSIQTAAGFYMLSLERATDGVMLYGDLTDEEQTRLREGGWNFNKKDELFNFKDITAEEAAFEKDHGYFFRKGQPPVVRETLTLYKTFEILDAKRISAITPGNQVYQGFGDVVNGVIVPTIGSHLPGLHPEYVTDETVRGILRNQLRTIYGGAWSELINQMGTSTPVGNPDFGGEVRKGITLEVEPQIGDGKTQVFSGKENGYDAKLGFMLGELQENLHDAILGEFMLDEGPYFLR